jgi:exodeoxyribonuclease V gamma subunit
VLHVHRAERADGLVEALGGLLREPLDDPFATEVVSVPTRGMERWLTQRLSAVLGVSEGRADGVCANVDFPPPRRLAGDAVAAASGIDPETDPWLPERAVWPLLEIVDEALGEPWLARLAGHLGADGDDPSLRGRRFTVVRHLADLFDRYALHRPEMVAAWVRGDGAGGEAAWQAELWRRLRDRLSVPGPAERTAVACARLRDDPSVADLPPRLVLFGLTRLPAGHLDVLRALAAHRDVHLFLLHPSPALWDRIAERPPERVVRRHADPTSDLPRNRLLASWGRDAREMQVVLRSADGHVDHHHEVAHAGGTLLAALQRAVREDLPAPADGERAPLDPRDRSVEVHACHGRARQVEVLRDAVLHLLDEDPTLEPRDVIVMCPDIETFAPLVQAVFGAGEVAHDEEAELETVPPEARPPDLRVRLADRSLRQTNPVLGVVAQLLELADGRLTASQVLDLADREPVRCRFRLDDDDLARVEQWVGASGIRWGLDAEHRAPFRLGALTAGTWRAGLDRLLVGVTMAEEEQRLLAGVLPLDDVDSQSIDLAGRLAELVARLRAAVDSFARPQTMGEWAAAIAEAADALTVTSPRDAWQRAQLQRLLDAAVAEASAAEPTLTLPEVRALLAERLQGRPTRANFRTGHLTICTLMPMRSVPHRVVCLLGLDDGAFPRKAPHDGDDLIVSDPHVGDRDPRAEDRQMLLDALLAAKERLVVTYAGKDERTNTPRPPAVPVGELLDLVDRTVAAPDGRPARRHVVVEHPLQPFDPRNFEPGELRDGSAWSFDRVTLDGARALVGERAAPAPFLVRPLPAPREPLVELETLVRFVERPVRTFLRTRLGISLGASPDEVGDALPVELDALQKWSLGERLLAARLAGSDPQSAYRAELARGLLPPGLLAMPVVTEVLGNVEDVVGALGALGVLDRDPRSLDARVPLEDGRLLSGTVAGVRGDALVTVTYSRVGPRHRLAAWARLLALAAAHPRRAFEAVTVGRAQAGAHHSERVTVARVRAPEDAGRHLRALVDLYDRGMREVPPIACLTSAAYARAAHEDADPVEAAAGQWESRYRFDGEAGEPEHRFVLGDDCPFDRLLAEPARADERGDGWDESEPSRFGRHARRLWDGLLGCEEVTTT